MNNVISNVSCNHGYTTYTMEIGSMNLRVVINVAVKTIGYPALH